MFSNPCYQTWHNSFFFRHNSLTYSNLTIVFLSSKDSSFMHTLTASPMFKTTYKYKKDLNNNRIFYGHNFTSNYLFRQFLVPFLINFFQVQPPFLKMNRESWIFCIKVGMERPSHRICPSYHLDFNIISPIAWVSYTGWPRDHFQAP